MPQTLVHLIPPGLCYMALSAFGFALMTACVKAVSGYGIPVMEIIAARALVSLILSYLDIRRKKISVWGGHKALLFARGVIGTVTMMATYYAVTLLPLAEATVIQYLHPVFTAVLAIIFLKETLRLTTVISSILGLSGLAIIVLPTITAGADMHFPPFSLAASLSGAFGSAVAYVLVRKLSQREDHSVIIFYFPLIALPVSLMILGTDFVVPALWPGVLLLLLGVSAQVGQIGLTMAMKCNDAAIVTAYSYVQIIFSAALGWVIFDEIPLITTAIGGILIVVGALVNALGSRTVKTQSNSKARQD